MGRGKIEIKKIENTTNRQVTFSKRRSGLFKKAKEISILCAADVAVIVFNNTGRLFDFASSSMKRILERYRNASGGIAWNNEYKQMLSQFRNLREENEELRKELSCVTGEDVETFTPKQLGYLEENLVLAAKKVRERKIEVLKYERRKTESKVIGLQQKCSILKEWLTNPENGKENDLNDCNWEGQTLPPAFRVQPSQRNLQRSGY
ncbi:MADS-box transcription factor 23 isoform X2 [Cryptomeria japonica]|uniref:MADS-box transcription factor 23 isoform X2 n=1 Tax=Cryptomeria japonica TaxID=3369 RepID=UPI0027DA457C|nr:MADS-box transcription factor 23 isoform X2 [Cryptomeria japonica]